MSVAGHTLETQRLDLRWLTPGDAGLMLAIWNDPGFLEHVGDRGIRTVDEAERALIEGPLRLYREHGYGPYRLSLRGTDTAIGICGLFRRDGLDDPDIGFALLPEYCGKGYAEEAARAVVAHARDGLGLTRLTAIVSPGNAASIRLIRNIGLDFERMHRMPADSEDVALYSVAWK